MCEIENNLLNITILNLKKKQLESIIFSESFFVIVVCYLYVAYLFYI